MERIVFEKLKIFKDNKNLRFAEINLYKCPDLKFYELKGLDIETMEELKKISDNFWSLLDECEKFLERR